MVERGEGPSVSLFLYDRAGQLLVTLAQSPQALLLPTYFECDPVDLVQYQTVTESGY